MAAVAHGRRVNRSRKAHSPRSSPCDSCSWRTARAAALVVTPRYDSATGIMIRLVKISTDTPMLAVIARSWITGIVMISSTRKPTPSAASAVKPARNRRRKV